MTEDLQSIAAKVAQVDEGILKALPFISTMINFIPGGAAAEPFMPLIMEALTALDNAARAVAAGNNSAAIDAVLTEIKSHLTPGMPASPALK